MALISIPIGEVKSPHLFIWTTGVGQRVKKRGFKRGIYPTIHFNLGGKRLWQHQQLIIERFGML
jgi:hypothetical protein